MLRGMVGKVQLSCGHVDFDRFDRVGGERSTGQGYRTSSGVGKGVRATILITYRMYHPYSHRSSSRYSG